MKIALAIEHLRYTMKMDYELLLLLNFTVKVAILFNVPIELFLLCC